MSTKKYVDIRVIGISDTDIRDFLELLAKIQRVGELGCNRTIPVNIDGDGSGKFKFDVITPEDATTPKIDLKETFKKSLYSFDYQVDNLKVDTHFLGE